MKSMVTLAAFIAIMLFTFCGCSGSKYASGSMHNHGVSNKSYRGY